MNNNIEKITIINSSQTLIIILRTFKNPEDNKIIMTKIKRINKYITYNKIIINMDNLIKAYNFNKINLIIGKIITTRNAKIILTIITINNKTSFMFENMKTPQ